MLSNNRDIYVGVMEEQREHNAVNFPLFYLLNISHILLCMLQTASGNQAFYFIPFCLKTLLFSQSILVILCLGLIWFLPIIIPSLFYLDVLFLLCGLLPRIVSSRIPRSQMFEETI